jgi:RHS repeat-associated protein
MKEFYNPQFKTRNMKYIKYIKTLLIMMVLCLMWSVSAQAQTTFYTDDCSSGSGWTLGQGSTSGSNYTAWRIGSTCSIDGSTLGINAWNGSYWLCEYWWDIDASSGIVAYKTIDATNYENLDFTFDYVSDGNSGDHGKVGYSTDGGQNFTWISTGGPYGNGKYYNKSSIQRDNSISLPASLNETSFQIAFRWKNNGSGGDDPAMYVDNIRLSGDEVSTSPSTYEEFYVNDCSSSTEWTLEQGTNVNGRYTAWKVSNTCSIDGNTLAINAYYNSQWYCEYWWDIDNSNGIVAHTTIDASSHENLELIFDYLADGNSSDYGRVGYSTDGGQTFTWFTTGGKYGAGKYYNLNSIHRDEEIILPASLDATSFEVAFIWYNNGSSGDDPGFYLDNIRVGGDLIESDDPKDTVAYDDMSNNDGWILENTDSFTVDGNYTGWRITDDCPIDSSVLAVAMFDNALPTWSCGYHNLDNSNGIIAHKEFNTIGYKNIDLSFDWNAGGQSSGSTGVDYGQVGYSLDEGATYTWLTTGGKNGAGEFYEQSSTTNEFYALPEELNNTVFQLAFRWINNAVNGTNPGFTIDVVSIFGDPMAIPLTIIASDDFEVGSNWTLGATDPASNGNYTGWNISSNCGINNKSLMINKRDGNDFTWNCSIESTIDNSSGIIAYRAIDASNANNLVLSFNWKCDSEQPAYGSVVYSLDGGLTFSALDHGGDGGGFYYQNSSVASETVLLPSILDNTNFLIGFQWFNDTQSGGTATFTIDDLEIKGVYTGTGLVSPFGSNIGTINSVQLEIITQAGKQNEAQVDVLDEWGKQMSISYMDGLGRNVQNVSYRATSNHKDFVQPFAYNKYGQSDVNYLPYPNDVNTGKYWKNWAFDQGLVYSILKNEDYPKAVAIVESSPRAKVNEQGSVGPEFQPGGKTVKPKTKVDIEGSQAEGNFIKAFEINGNGSLTVYKYSAAKGYSKLFVSEVEDTEGITTKSYTNSNGQIILIRKYDENDSVLIQMYNVYDEYRRLRFVVQPQGVANLPNLSSFPNGFSPVQDFIDDWCFQYKYDERGRMISKKVPGGGWIEMAHDKWDRLVMTQDAVQLGKNPQEFTFVKYDRLNRPVITGIYSKVGSNMTIASHHIYMNGTEFDEERYELRTDGSGVEDYTTTRTYPDHNTGNAVQKILTVTYYDDYDYSNISGLSFTPTLGYNATDQNTNTAGLATGVKINILGTTDYLRSVNYYDQHNRIIQVQNQNIIGLYSTITSEYDFVGNVIETEEINKFRNASEIITTTINTRNEYDHMNRLTKTFHDINNEGEILLAEYNYNEFGEQEEKNLHSTDGGSTFLQSVDYSYNSKGWLTQINQPDLSSEFEDDNNDLFGMQLNYYKNMLTGSGGIKKKYNGNIAEIVWQRSGSTQNAYVYNYDGLERIKSADFFEHNGSALQDIGGSGLIGVNYDKNGNIKHLSRSVPGMMPGLSMDNLTYAYDGNRLLSVTDPLSYDGYNGEFIDGNTSGNDYVYDVGGNMIEDKNKGIVNIKYNHLNLPSEVEYESSTGNKILYIYDANGIKLQKKVRTADSYSRYVDYIGSVQFENHEVSFVNTSEGRIVPNGSVYDYEYFLKDQLGNIRVTFHEHPDSSGVAKLLNGDDYFPFGIAFNSYVTSTNEYKFQGQEHQGDHGLNWDGFKWRNSMPDLGRFFNIDPLAHDYTHNSPYAFSENMVIHMVELEGLEAWDIKRDWEDEDLEKYQQYVRDNQEYWDRKDFKCDCADFGVKVLMDFAEKNGLPLSFNTADGGQISGQDKDKSGNYVFDSKEDFLEVAKDRMNAESIKQNVFTINESNASEGDLRIGTRSLTGEADHLVIISDKKNNEVIYGNPYANITVSIDVWKNSGDRLTYAGDGKANRWNVFKNLRINDTNWKWKVHKDSQRKQKSTF